MVSKTHYNDTKPVNISPLSHEKFTTLDSLRMENLIFSFYDQDQNYAPPHIYAHNKQIKP